jgi:hypothetical protein
MSKRTKPTAATAARSKPPIVVHGVDENGKPRAARFPGDQVDLVNKAAALMSLQFCRATSPDMVEIALKLPAGRIYSTGRGFVPFVRRQLYDKLIEALVGSKKKPKAPSQTASGMPRTWKEIGVGHLVLAQWDPAGGDGWWEARVIATDGEMLTLKWRNEPRQPKEVRHRLTVALLDPDAHQIAKDN